jgi:diguanylate cyclase (GGDEF)-like protein/PAS domain S-box-containing protein
VQGPRDEYRQLVSSGHANESSSPLLHEGKLAEAFERVSDAFYAVDREWRFTYVNRRAQELWCRSQEDLLGKSIWEEFPQAVGSESYQKINQAMEEGVTVEFETVSPLLDRWIAGRAYPSAGGLSVYFQDVTERKRVEEAMRESNRRIENILESITDEFFAMDREWRFTYINERALRRIQGEKGEELTREELLGKNAWELYPELVGTVFYQNYHEALREQKALHFEEYSQLTEMWFEVNVYPSEEGLSVYFRDVTERKWDEEQLSYYAALKEDMHDAFIATDERLVVRVWNKGAERMYGITAEEALGRDAREVISLEMRDEELAEALQEIEDTGRLRVEQVQHHNKSGTPFYVDSLTVAMRGERGDTTGYLTINRDITERKRLDEERRRTRSAALRADVSTALSEGGTLRGVLQHCTECMVRHLDAAFARIWTLDEEENVLELQASAGMYTHLEGIHSSVPVGELKIGLIAQERQPHLTNAVTSDPRISDREWAKREGMVAFAGHPLIVENRVVGIMAMFARRVLTEDTVESLASVADTIAQGIERRRAEERLRHQAFYDPLTDLPNRRLFVDRLQQALRRTSRTRGRRVAVLFLDLDNFKVINDSLGHELGDKLLVAMAERLRTCLRPEDTLARFGGDEFTVLLEEVANPKDAVRVANRVVERFRGPFILDGKEFFATASIGIAMGTAGTKNPEELLRDADTAMYKAKAEGMDYRVFNPQMYLWAVNRLELENDLRRAIEAEEFNLHYQPIVNTESGEVRGVEALVRWNHPERGLLDPREFVPLAEESGLVIPMDEQVLEEACRQVKEWQEEHPRIPPVLINVNLSARQLQRPGLATTVEEVLQRTGLEATCLSLDITETVYIKALEGNTAALDELKGMGAKISIDDFGVGYSSLSYLKRLPADVLKIDKAFLKGLGEDVENTAIVRMAIELAHTFGMEVVAEGVEDRTQAALLREMGCDMAQGYYFSEPLPSEVAAEFLMAERTL